MKHLKAINRKAARMEEVDQGRRRAPAGRPAATARAAAHSDRLLAGVFARLGSGPQRRHRGTVSAGRARSVRLPHGLLLAGAGARPAESRARLDGEMRRGAERLAQDRSDLPGQEMNGYCTDDRALAASRISSAFVPWPCPSGCCSSSSVQRSASGSGVTLTGGNTLLYIGTYAGQRPDLRRGHREADRRDQAADRHSALADPLASTKEVLRARFDARKDRGRRHRLAQYARAPSRSAAATRRRASAACRSIRSSAS